MYGSVNLPDTYEFFVQIIPVQEAILDVYPEGEWITPLGTATVDEDLVNKLIERFPLARKDGRAHVR